MAIGMVLQKNGIGGFVRMLPQFHLGLLGGEITFSGVASFARCYQVGPGVRTTARTGYNVVQREIFTGTAILTFEIIAFENVLPGKVHPFERRTYVPVKPDYGGHRESVRHRMQFVPVGRPHQFTLVQVHEHKGALNGANHQWAKILIEYQHTAIHQGNIKPIFGFFKTLRDPATRVNRAKGVQRRA